MIRGRRVFVWLVMSVVFLPVPVEAARLEVHEGLPVAYLEGTPYELGYQHGQLLRDTVQHAVAHILGYFRGYLKFPLIGGLAMNWWLDRPWKQALPFIPAEYLEELRGLADASGVPLRELWRLHAIPDRTYACSGLAVWGQATADGRLIHTRNLDWNIDAGIQRYAVVFIVNPKGKHAYVNLGWAGFIGVLTGVNDQRISIGQVGAETTDLSYRGLPMTFVMRKVLQEAGDLDEAVRVIQAAPRTVGVNYVLADAKVPRAVVMETTRQFASVFGADDPKEHAVSYARPMTNCVFRADTAMDPQIRDWQLASDGNPSIPGLEPPGGSAYEVRYLGQAAGISAHYGQISVQVAMQIAKAVAPSSNIQSVIFAWPQVWVANAQGTTPAARTAYHRFDLERLFATPPATRP